MEKEVHKKEIPWHSLSLKEIQEKLNSNEKGLSDSEAKKRLEKYGKNEITQTRKFRPIKILLEQFNSFIIYILIAAGIVMYYLGHSIDAYVILAVVLVNAGIGFFQQYKAEKAIMSLKKMLVPHSKVMRDKKLIEVPSEEIVPGDIIVLSEGDKVNADARIIETTDLQTNEAALTGESLPVLKTSKVLPKSKPLSKRGNMLFTGTQVVAGEAKAIVISTGMDTAFGKIAGTLQEIEDQETPMQKRLNKFSKQLGIFIVVLVSVILGVGLLAGLNLVDMFLISVALAVSAIPAGLPAVLAIAFSISSIMMSRKSVIVRKLPTVETLGSVTVICTDKTGTLTEEEMTVQEIYAGDKLFLKKGKNLIYDSNQVKTKDEKELSKLFEISVLCNNSRLEYHGKKPEVIGDPTEAALVKVSLEQGIDKIKLTEKHPEIKEFKFDSERKMMSSVREKENGKTIYTKGASEKILGICSTELVNGRVKKLTDQRKKEILKESREMEGKALRVLGFAYRNLKKKEKPKEEGLIFVGFLGMIDPPRKEVKGAISQCKAAGIRVKMITGDSPATAKAIAEKIGIEGKMVTEKELQEMSDADLFDSIEEISVFARMTPHQKLRITKILQQKSDIVAITGDGVNDVLALKSADIGISMGKRGTDVARDVSDVVLIDDNFASIVQGVKEGRKTYDNIKKFTKYFLAVNFSEVFIILVAIILGVIFGSDIWYLPLLPLQILWINLITDSLPAIALVFEKPESVMKSKPRSERSILDGIAKFIIAAGLITFVAKFANYLIGIASGFPEEKTQTLVLTTAIFFELVFVYTCRSDKPLKDIGVFSNKWLNYAVIIALALHLILLYTPLGGFFGTVPLGLTDWLLVIPFGLLGIVVFEIAKTVRKNSRKKKK